MWVVKSKECFLRRTCGVVIHFVTCTCEAAQCNHKSYDVCQCLTHPQQQQADKAPCLKEGKSCSFTVFRSGSASFEAKTIDLQYLSHASLINPVYSITDFISAFCVFLVTKKKAYNTFSFLIDSLTSNYCRGRINCPDSRERCCSVSFRPRCHQPHYGVHVE